MQYFIIHNPINKLNIHYLIFVTFLPTKNDLNIRLGRFFVGRNQMNITDFFSFINNFNTANVDFVH